MEWLQQNVWVLVIAAIVLVLVVISLAVYLMIKVRIITRNTVDSSLKMTANLMYESDLGTEFIDISIFNTNFRDVTVKDFGITYRNQHLNFIAEYIKTKKLGGVPIVAARSSINFRVDPQKVEQFVLEHNYKSKNIEKIYVSVVDSIGNQFTRKNNALTKVLKDRQKDRLKKAKLYVHNQKIEEYKKTHDDREPLSNAFWKLFHRNRDNLPRIIEVANSLSLNEKFVKAPQAQIPDARPKREEVPSDEQLSVQETEILNSTSGDEIKLTYLNTTKPTKSRKKVEEKPTVEELPSEEKSEEPQEEVQESVLETTKE